MSNIRRCRPGDMAVVVFDADQCPPEHKEELSKNIGLLVTVLHWQEGYWGEDDYWSPPGWVCASSRRMLRTWGGLSKRALFEDHDLRPIRPSEIAEKMLETAS